MDDAAAVLVVAAFGAILGLVCAVLVLFGSLDKMRSELDYTIVRIDDARERGYTIHGDLEGLAAAAGFKRAARVHQPSWEPKL